MVAREMASPIPRWIEPLGPGGVQRTNNTSRQPLSVADVDRSKETPFSTVDRAAIDLHDSTRTKRQTSTAPTPMFLSKTCFPIRSSRFFRWSFFLSPSFSSTILSRACCVWCELCTGSLWTPGNRRERVRKVTDCVPHFLRFDGAVGEIRPKRPLHLQLLHLSIYL